jgi:hypothetical protein
MSEARIIEARGIWKLLLGITGCAAFAAPWRIVYVLAPYLHHEALLAHERVHLEQIDREGPVMFSVKYLWWLATKGYWNHPYELEAYQRAPL